MILRLLRECFRLPMMLLTGLMLMASFGAQAEDPFPKITPELYDELNASLETTWPHDPAVPDLPPMPVTDDPQMNPNAFLWTHFDDNVYPPRVKGVPMPRTRIVTEDDPLEVDVYWSMRSPYSYLTLNRLVWLNSNYNVNVNIRPVLPVAVRSTSGGSGKAGGLFSLPYKVPDSAWDSRRQGKYLGFRFHSRRPTQSGRFGIRVQTFRVQIIGCSRIHRRNNLTYSGSHALPATPHSKAKRSISLTRFPI